MFVSPVYPIMTTTSDLPDTRKQLGDRFAIERELGRGGMRAVHLARDLRLDRPVALEVLPTDLAGDSSRRERFLGETRTAASFSHPNIVPVHAVEACDGALAFAMGFVGADPGARRRRRKTVIIALLHLPIAILPINTSLNVRLSLGRKAVVVHTESREPTRRSLGMLAMAASGLSLLGVSFLLLARSPFRMPPGERMFRVVWLGPLGRWFVRFSSRNATPPSSGKFAPGLAGMRANVNIAETGRVAAPVVATTATPTDRMRSLEDRLAARALARRSKNIE